MPLSSRIDPARFISAFQQLLRDKLPDDVNYLVGLLTLRDQEDFRRRLGDDRIRFLRLRFQPLYTLLANGNMTEFLKRPNGIIQRHTFTPDTTLQQESPSTTQVSEGPEEGVSIRPVRNHRNITVVSKPPLPVYRISVFPSISDRISRLVPPGLNPAHVDMWYGRSILPMDAELGELGIPDNATIECVMKIRGGGDGNRGGGNDGDAERRSNQYVKTMVLQWITRGEISTIMNYLAQHVARVDQDILPFRSAIPIAKTLTFRKQENPGWTVEVILGSPLKEAEVPSGSEGYVADLKTIGSLPTPLTLALTGTGGGNVYYGRDGSGTKFYGDFSTEGCNALAEVCKAIVSQPNTKHWFGDATAPELSQICRPVGICITLSVEETNPWCDVSVLDNKPQPSQISDSDLSEEISALVAYGGWKAKIEGLEGILQGLHPGKSYPMYCVTSKHEILELDMVDHKKFLDAYQQLGTQEYLDDTIRSSLEKYMDYAGRNKLKELPANECARFLQKYPQLQKMFETIQEIVKHKVHTPKQLVLIGEDKLKLLNLLIKQNTPLKSADDLLSGPSMVSVSFSSKLNNQWELWGNVYDRSTITGDFSDDGCKKLKEHCQTLLETQTEDGMPNEIRIALSVPPNHPWDGTTVTCTSGFSMEKAHVPPIIQEALQKRYAHPSDVYVVVYARPPIEVLGDINNGFPKSVPRCLIVDSESEVTIPDITKFVSHGKRDEDIYVFLTKQLEEAGKTFTDDQQHATRIAKVHSVAQQIVDTELLGFLNANVQEAFKLCGVGQILEKAKYNTLQANCSRGGDFTTPTFSMCLWYQLMNSLLKKCAMESVQTDETSVEITTCKIIAKTWINNIKQSLDARWKSCRFEKDDSENQMRAALTETFLSDSPDLTRPLDLTGFTSHTEELSDAEGEFDEPLKTEKIRRGDALSFVRDVAVKSPTGTEAKTEKRWVKVYFCGDEQFAEQYHACVTGVNDYCASSAPLCPREISFNRSKSEIELEYLDPQDGWMPLTNENIKKAKLAPGLEARLRDSTVLRNAIHTIWQAGVYAPKLKLKHIVWCSKTGEIRVINFGALSGKFEMFPAVQLKQIVASEEKTFERLKSTLMKLL